MCVDAVYTRKPAYMSCPTISPFLSGFCIFTVSNSCCYMNTDSDFLSERLATVAPIGSIAVLTLGTSHRF